MRFEIGQKVWVADFSPLSPEYDICPDCGGTGRLRVTFHDETQVSIECKNCSVGYDPPTGRVIVRRHSTTARQAIISGFAVRGTETEWQIDGTANSWRTVDDDAVFDTEEDAIAYAKRCAADNEAEQRARIANKEKDTRSWAWNASYHRKCIKDAQKQIDYHTSKLAVAAIKAKEDKAVAA